MTPADHRLKALFAEDLPLARDAAFSAEVSARLARRQCLADLAVLAGLSAVGGLALWGLWPSLQPALVAVSDRLAPAAWALAIAFCAVAALGGLGERALLVES
jgi:hypothetical protein